MCSSCLVNWGLKSYPIRVSKNGCSQHPISISRFFLFPFFVMILKTPSEITLGNTKKIKLLPNIRYDSFTWFGLCDTKKNVTAAQLKWLRKKRKKTFARQCDACDFKYFFGDSRLYFWSRKLIILILSLVVYVISFLCSLAFSRYISTFPLSLFLSRLCICFLFLFCFVVCWSRFKSVSK